MIRHYTKAEVADMREAFPAHWIVERVIAGRSACLIAIPATEENRVRELTVDDGHTIPGEMLDGASIRTPEALDA